MQIKSDNDVIEFNATGGNDVVFKQDGVEITRASILKDAGSSMAGNGYQKLPSGLIIQWGTTTAASAASGTSTTTTLPIAFITNCVTALATNTGAVGGNSTYNTTAKTVSSFTVERGNSSNIETGLDFNWIAIGY